jgi:membrane protease YdiL (CAAX protease family)
MDYSLSQSNTAQALHKAVQSDLSINETKRSRTYIFAETILVTTIAIATIRLLLTSSASQMAWFLAPSVLVAAAFIPTVLRKDEFAPFGFNFKQIRFTLKILFWTCALVFPIVLFASRVLAPYGLSLPLRPLIPKGSSWVGWFFYQFMYVAVAEEVFFRGYLQSNILTLINTLKQGQLTCDWISITISAALFGIAHIIAQGQIISVVTFIPGLILGWLFIRTKSLLAPILFHGLANAFYCLMTITVI